MHQLFRANHLRKLEKLFQPRPALTRSSLVVCALLIPLQAQLPTIPQFNLQTPNFLNRDSDSDVVSGCIRLDGRCLFRVADQSSDLAERIETIEARLSEISSAYFSDEVTLQVNKRTDGNLPNIFVSAGDKQIRLLSVTSLDAEIEGVSIDARADHIIERLQIGLTRAKQERQSNYLIRQGIIAGVVFSAMLVASLSISQYGRRSKRKKDELASSSTSHLQPISTQLDQQKQLNVQEVQHRLYQIAQTGIWVGGSLLILGLFPYTRVVQFLIITALRIPLRIGIVTAGTYFLVRLCYALINRSTSALATNYLGETNQRIQLRVSTVSDVAKSIVTISLSGIGILVALSLIGVDIGPLLAGAGLIGVAVSFASQSLIKDAINGFFIILEDQYAIGDVIAVGDVGGLVEDINLRITRLRDAEGRLITVPNSEIRIVANLSSNWSRADLIVPVAYQADLDKALKIIHEASDAMHQDPDWKNNILEPPAVLGVDNFEARGLVVRVWIKTLPLKQWEVAREFRRRIKIAFEQAGIPIPLPQQQVWFHDGALPQLVLKQHNRDR